MHCKPLQPARPDISTALKICHTPGAWAYGSLFDACSLHSETCTLTCPQQCMHSVRNKFCRVTKGALERYTRADERVLWCAVDHPFVASLYGTIQTGTHLHFLMEYCEGGELYGLLTTQPTKRLKEAHMRFYVAEVRASQPSLPCVLCVPCAYILQQVGCTQ